MAEEKKSFILYADQINTVEKLPDEIAGKLFKTILEYVNDKNPKVEDLILQIAFEPIKQQLKRDLKKWERFQAKQSENGKLGGRPKKENPKNPSLFSESQKSLNVNVNVNDNVTDNVNVSEEEPTPQELIQEKNFEIQAIKDEAHDKANSLPEEKPKRKYQAGAEVFNNVGDYLNKRFQILLNDQKVIHGELKINDWIEGFSILHNEKTWKDDQDFRHHITSYFNIQSKNNGKNSNPANGSKKSLNTTQNTKFGRL